MSQVDAAAAFLVNKSTIIRVARAGALLSLKKTEQPRSTSVGTDKQMRRNILQQPTMTTSQLKAAMLGLMNEVSMRTVRHRRSKQLNLPARRPIKKRPLTGMEMIGGRFCSVMNHLSVSSAIPSSFFISQSPNLSPADACFTHATVKHSPSADE